ELLISPAQVFPVTFSLYILTSSLSPRPIVQLDVAVFGLVFVCLDRLCGVASCLVFI
ncbi:hypothetical protein QQF64_011765, partial [Cirrhinus molitorella]